MTCKKQISLIFLRIYWLQINQDKTFDFKKKKKKKKTRAVVGQRSSPAGYILYCNIFIIKPYNIGHTDLDVFVCKSFCHIDIIIRV